MCIIFKPDPPQVRFVVQHPTHTLHEHTHWPQPRRYNTYYYNGCFRFLSVFVVTLYLH